MRNRMLLGLACLVAAGTVVERMRGAASGATSEMRVGRAAIEVGAPEPVSLPVPAERSGKSQLPLTLLGTFAAGEPSLSRATIRDRESQETLVVGVGDVIDRHALVLQIERERVLLREQGSIRELSLDAEHAPSDPGRGADLERGIRDSMIGQPHQARVLPELEGDRLVGLHVSEIQDGSRFAQLGIEEDDVITQFDGVPIDSPFLALHVVREMVDSGRYQVVVRRGGATTQLQWGGAGS